MTWKNLAVFIVVAGVFGWLFWPVKKEDDGEPK